MNENSIDIDFLSSLRHEIVDSVALNRQNIQLKKEIELWKQKFKDEEQKNVQLINEKSVLESKLQISLIENENLKNKIADLEKTNKNLTRNQKRQQKQTVQEPPKVEEKPEEEASTSEITDEDISALFTDDNNTESENPKEEVPEKKSEPKKPRKVFSKTRTDIPTLIKIIEKSNNREITQLVSKILLEYYPSLRSMKQHFVSVVNAIILRLFESDDNDATIDNFTFFLMSFVKTVMPQCEDKIKAIFNKRPKILSYIEFFNVLDDE